MPVEKQLDRPAGRLSEQGSMNLPGDVLFAARSSADHHADNAHILFRPVQNPGDLAAIGVRDLGTDVDLYAPLIGQP